MIYGAGKTPGQLAAIAAKIVGADRRVLATRVHEEHAQALQSVFPNAIHHPAARLLTEPNLEQRYEILLEQLDLLREDVED